MNTISKRSALVLTRDNDLNALNIGMKYQTVHGNMVDKLMDKCKAVTLAATYSFPSGHLVPK